MGDTMRKVLITGGARGIGRGITAAFASDHAVAVTYNSTPPDALLDAHPGLIAIQADLSTPTSATTVIDAAIKNLGGLDIIVNNAGAMHTDATDTGENYAVNVAAPIALLDAALPFLKSGACIINISSVNANLPAMGAASYSASKAALNTWTRAMAKALGPQGIRVNAVAPGAIERIESPRDPELIAAFVGMTALGRIGTPEDIANVIRFLAGGYRL
jgi:3-oxoacyl-[acyl-carrier protein] reductase